MTKTAKIIYVQDGVIYQERPTISLLPVAVKRYRNKFTASTLTMNTMDAVIGALMTCAKIENWDDAILSFPPNAVEIRKG